MISRRKVHRKHKTAMVSLTLILLLIALQMNNGPAIFVSGVLLFLVCWA